MRSCGIVVGANLLAALGAADLRAARIAALGSEPFLLGLVEPRAENGHRLELVLELAALVLAGDHQAGRHMGDAHRGVGGVDALAAIAGRAVDIDAQIVFRDLDVDLFGFRKHRNAGGGGVNASLTLCRGNALHAMHPAFVAKIAVGVLAGHLEDDFAVAAAVGLGRGEDLDFPALSLGIAGVHAEEIGREERRFVPAGAGAHFDDDVLGVVRVLRHEQRLDAAHQDGLLLLERCGSPRRPSRPFRDRLSLASSSASEMADSIASISL